MRKVIWKRRGNVEEGEGDKERYREGPTDSLLIEPRSMLLESANVYIYIVKQ